MKKIILNGELGKDKLILVDNENYKELNKYKWSSKHGYAYNKKLKQMHRLIMDCPRGMEVDHIDGNPLNNQKSNLRICTLSENRKNRKKSLNKTSEYKGVSWNKHNKSWRAYIGIERKNNCIGYFKNERHAAMAYDLWARELHGKFARLNFKNN